MRVSVSDPGVFAPSQLRTIACYVPTSFSRQPTLDARNPEIVGAPAGGGEGPWPAECCSTAIGRPGATPGSCTRRSAECAGNPPFCPMASGDCQGIFRMLHDASGGLQAVSTDLQYASWPACWSRRSSGTPSNNASSSRASSAACPGPWRGPSRGRRRRVTRRWSCGAARAGCAERSSVLSFASVVRQPPPRRRRSARC